MADTFKVCLAGTSTPVEGTTTFATLVEVEEWLMGKQVYYDENDPEKPVNDGSKYVVLPSDMN
jgi:hypothetical protein